MEYHWKIINKQLEFEKTLYEETIQCIIEFGKINQYKELFYALALETGLRNGHLGLSLNTSSHLEKEISEYQSKNSNLPEEEIDELKYDPGNWKYQAFNKFEFPSISRIWNKSLGSKINQIYEAFENIIYNTSLKKEEIDSRRNELIIGFNNSVKNVTYKIRQDEVIRSIKTTKDFIVYSIDFDDDISEIVNNINLYGI